MSDYYLNKADSVFDKYPKLKNLECFDGKRSEHAKNFTEAEWKSICKYVVYRADRDCPLAELSEESQIRKEAFSKSYMPSNIAEMIISDDDGILFINEMKAEFLLCVSDYRMMELISIRGNIRNIILSSISPNLELQTSSQKDASHHKTMVATIKDFPYLADRAIELEEEIFGIKKEEGEEKGGNWAMATISERMAGTALSYDN